MPLILPNAAPDNRYMVASLSRPGRSMIIFISGVCSLEECRAFLTACDPALCPVQAQPYFQNPVDVSSKGFSILGGVPKTLRHFHEDFAVWAFTDLYTFEISRYILMEWCLIPQNREMQMEY